MAQGTDKCQGRQLFTDTKRVTCDLSSVGNQEGNNQMTQDTVKCRDPRIHRHLSLLHVISSWITRAKRVR